MDDVWNWKILDPLLVRAVREDLGRAGDITTDSIIPLSAKGRGILIAKEDGVIAGLPLARRIFFLTDSRLSWESSVPEGMNVDTGGSLASVSGPLRPILRAERTVLNFVQRLSGIATLTSRFVSAVEGTGVKILDTRKTTPLYRNLEKYAVRMGGGVNHRFGLFDQVLVKNNHVDASGGVTQALVRCLEELRRKRKKVRITVEARNLDEVEQALAFPIHRIMLDNMDLTSIRKAVRRVDRRVELEVSGNVGLDNVAAIARTGVDCISVGQLTHSPGVLDLALRISAI
jgi:nicotinate-nucleotide pyrophosphorylase (carboxylating)